VALTQAFASAAEDSRIYHSLPSRLLLDASNARKLLKMNTKKLTHIYLCYVICSHAQTVTQVLLCAQELSCRSASFSVAPHLCRYSLVVGTAVPSVFVDAIDKHYSEQLDPPDHSTTMTRPRAVLL
jgi:hypothetical protein